jgi:hypothetical protein
MKGPKYVIAALVPFCLEFGSQKGFVGADMTGDRDDSQSAGLRKSKFEVIDMRRRLDEEETTQPLDFSAVTTEELLSSNPYDNPDPRNGPWPECLGWDGEDCMTYIQTLSPEVRSLHQVKPVNKDNHRVYIIVDEYGVVSLNPHRG